MYNLHEERILGGGTPSAELAAAVTALQIAGDALQTAADMLSDVNCDRFADRGGIGRPPKDHRIEALYRFAGEVETVLGAVDSIHHELSA